MHPIRTTLSTRLLSIVLVLGNGGAAAAVPLPSGQWGGPHISLTVTDRSATLQYDCAHGTIAGPLDLGENGSFRWAGTHSFEHGGPVRSGERIDQLPARYTGRVEGDRMTVVVTLTGTGQEIGTYQLQYGSAGQINHCL